MRIWTIFFCIHFTLNIAFMFCNLRYFLQWTFCALCNCNYTCVCVCVTSFFRPRTHLCLSSLFANTWPMNIIVECVYVLLSYLTSALSTDIVGFTFKTYLEKVSTVTMLSQEVMVSGLDYFFSLKSDLFVFYVLFFYSHFTIQLLTWSSVFFHEKGVLCSTIHLESIQNHWKGRKATP